MNLKPITQISKAIKMVIWCKISNKCQNNYVSSVFQVAIESVSGKGQPPGVTSCVLQVQDSGVSLGFRVTNKKRYFGGPID